MTRNLPIVVTKPTRPALPPSARTRGGTTFNPNDDKWAYREGVKTVSLDFASVSALSTEAQRSLKSTLLWYAENHSASHLVNLYARIKHLVRFIASTRSAPIETLTSADLLNYRASLTADVAWYLGALSGFLKKWHRLGFPGVSDDAASVLRELRIKGNAKGVAVLTMDPTDGPYTSLEHEAIQSALDEAYSACSIDEGPYLSAWLFMALGQRPVQYAALKVCDISASATPVGDIVYTLKMPRAKQRNEHPRAELKERPLVPFVGKPLLEYAQRVRQQFTERLEDPSQAPLFPQKGKERKRPTRGYEYHATAGTVSLTLKTVLTRLNVSSERTGGPIHITPTRFRRTFGTRAAQEGHGELVIAEMLDHTDTQNVGVYVAAVPEIAARIDRAIAMELAPLAQAFKGVVIKDESEATRGNDPSSRIIDLRIDRGRKTLASCGQHSSCQFDAPIACYTCKSFEPWADAPHEAVLDHLLAKREQLLLTADKRMASINDRTILAVAQVIQRCKDFQAQRGASIG